MIFILKQLINFTTLSECLLNSLNIYDGEYVVSSIDSSITTTSKITSLKSGSSPIVFSSEMLKNLKNVPMVNTNYNYAKIR